MIIKEKDILSDDSLGGQTSNKTNNSQGENLMNITNNKSALVNNSFTSNIQENICNCLGCNDLQMIKYL